MVHPIEQIADKEFAKSGKGLMALFAIGATHIFLGIKIETVKVSIPWFVELSVSNPERIILMYMLLVCYALYRYYLHTEIDYCEVRAQALSNLFNSWIGKTLTRNYVFSENCYSEATTFYNSEKKAFTVNINGYSGSDDEIPTEIMSIIVKDRSTLLLSLSWDQRLSNSPLYAWHKFKDVFGLKSPSPYDGRDDENCFETQTTQLVNRKITFPIGTLLFFYTLKTCFLTPKALDYILPFILNFSVMYYLLFTLLYRHFN